MKILKKILPLASIASVAAVAAPLATSCTTDAASAGTYTFSYDVEDTTGLTEYKPRFAPAPQQSTEAISPSIARLLYYNKLEADRSLLSDDFLCGLNAYILNMFKANNNATYTLSKLNGSSSLTVNALEPYTSPIRTQNDEKAELRKLSFTIKWKFEFTVITKNFEGEEVEKKGSIDQKFDFKNFILDITGNGKNAYVYIDMNDKCGWELSFNSATSFDGSSESGSIVWNVKNWHDKNATIATRFISGAKSLIAPQLLRFDNVAPVFSHISQMCLDDDGTPIMGFTHYLKNNKVYDK